MNHTITLKQAAPSPLQVEVWPQRDHVRVVPVGALDVATMQELEDQLQELRSSGWENIVLDLRELTFLDSTGIALIVAQDDFARANRHEFSLIPGPPAVQRALDICGLLEHLTFTSA